MPFILCSAPAVFRRALNKVVSSFIGKEVSLACYHELVPHFAHIAEQLYQLIRQNVPCHWDQALEVEFQMLKNASSEGMAFSDISKPYICSLYIALK